MRRAESVVDIMFGETRQLGRESRVVGFFAGVKAQVFEKRRVARAHFGERGFCFVPDAVADESDVVAEKLRQPPRDGREGLGFVPNAPGPAAMRAEYDAAAALAQVADGRQRFGDSAVVGYAVAAVGHRDVVVHPDQDARARRQVRVPNARLARHRSAPRFRESGGRARPRARRRQAPVQAAPPLRAPPCPPRPFRVWRPPARAGRTAPRRA